MFSAMSGTSERMSTMPAAAMVFAGEIVGGASAFAAAPTVARMKARTQAARLFTRTLPRECQVFVVIAEIGIRVDLGHVQRAAGLLREAQPRFGIAVGPVHQVLVADAHHFADQGRRSHGGELHGIALGAEMHFTEPRVAPRAEYALQFGRGGGLARRRVGHARDAALLVVAG